MSFFALVRPRDDGLAQQASDWADAVASALVTSGHTKSADVDDLSPPDKAHIVAALGSRATLICYFGHGDEYSWLTSGARTVTAADFTSAASKAVVSIACKTACNLGPDAVTAGVDTWLGFSIRVAIVPPHKGVDPIGDAIVAGLSVLGSSQTMQQARDELYAQLDQVVDDYDTGRFSGHPNSGWLYFVALAMRDHVALHGTASLRPL